MTIHVVVHRGRAVTSFFTLEEAREWISNRPDSVQYVIDSIPFQG